MNTVSVIASLKEQCDLVAVAQISKLNLMIALYDPETQLYEVTYADVSLDGERAFVDAFLFAQRVESKKDAIEYLTSKVSGPLLFVKEDISL